MRTPCFLLLMSCVACYSNNEEGIFEVSAVDPAPYFSIVESDSVELTVMEIDGRAYWNIKMGPWNAQIFTYRVVGVQSDGDFRRYASARSRMFTDDARDWLTDLEEDQKVIFPEPEVFTSTYRNEEYRESVAMYLVSLSPEFLTQAKLIRLYQFDRETISMELKVRGYCEYKFDFNTVDQMIRAKRPIIGSKDETPIDSND